jgi:hypothetical protein
MKSIAHVGASIQDLILIKKSFEYATQSGRPGQDWDGRVIIQSDKGSFVYCTGGKEFTYSDGCSDIWTGGKTPNGSKWRTIYTFENVITITVPEMLDLICDINQTLTGKGGKTYKPKRNQGINYIDIFGLK